MNKLMLGIGLTGTIVIGSVVFTGGDIIDRTVSKVNGMFEDLRLYESNEARLSAKIEELKNNKQDLLSKIEALVQQVGNKDTIIFELEEQAKDLQSQIEELESQLGNQGGLLNEIKRLEGEVNKANSKVAELESIVNTPIEGKPMTEDEMNNLLGNTNNNKISFDWRYEEGGELTSYAHYTSEPVKDEYGNTEYLKVTIFSVTDDGFEVEVGTNEGKSFTELVYRGKNLEFNIGKLEDGSPNWDYIIIGDEPRFEIVNFYEG